MKIITIILIFLFFSFKGYALNLPDVIPITGSYFGETLVHPGIYAGSEYTIKGGFFTSFGMGYYLHYRHHGGLFISGDVNWRKIFNCGYGLTFGIGIGYLHTWPHGGKIYTVDDQGHVDTKTNWGKPSFMPSLKLGLLSWDFRKKNIVPLRLFSDIVIFGEYPYNDYMMPHAALNIGATYYLKRIKDD